MRETCEIDDPDNLSPYHCKLEEFKDNMRELRESYAMNYSLDYTSLAHGWSRDYSSCYTSPPKTFLCSNSMKNLLCIQSLFHN